MANKRRKRYLGTVFQRKLLFLVFAAASIPTLIIGVCLYYLIFHMLAGQIMVPEAIAFNLIPVFHKVNVVIAVSIPILLLIFWVSALELSHRVAGPLYRMEKELDEVIAGNKREPIKLRKNDEFQTLVSKINKLIGR